MRQEAHGQDIGKSLEYSPPVGRVSTNDEPCLGSLNVYEAMLWRLQVELANAPRRRVDAAAKRGFFPFFPHPIVWSQCGNNSARKLRTRTPAPTTNHDHLFCPPTGIVSSTYVPGVARKKLPA